MSQEKTYADELAEQTEDYSVACFTSQAPGEQTGETDNKLTLNVTEDYRFFLSDLVSVLAQPAGCRVFIELLRRLHMFDEVWSPKNPNLAKNAVLRDVGQQLLDDLALADPNAYIKFCWEIRSQRMSKQQYNLCNQHKKEE